MMITLKSRGLIIYQYNSYSFIPTPLNISASFYDNPITKTSLTQCKPQYPETVAKQNLLEAAFTVGISCYESWHVG